MLTKTDLFPRAMSRTIFQKLAFERELNSLISEGYFLRFAHDDVNGNMIAKLSHYSNGNTMIVYVSDNKMTFKKNGKIVKQYEV